MAGFFSSLSAAVLYCLFYLVMLAGVLVIPLGLPGQFLIAFGALVVTLIAGAETLSWTVVLCLFGLAILAETIEALAGFWGAGKAKGSFWSGVAAIAGGLVGAVLGSLAAPVIGSLFGALAGTFAGAYLIEYYRTRTRSQATRVARGALIGRILGSIAKVFLAISMIVIVTLALIA